MKKKYLLYAIIAFILAFCFWSISHADGGFLNVSFSGSNTHGGTLQASDFTFDVSYDGGTDVVKGNAQGLYFPRHTDPAVPLSYTVTVEPVAGYTFSLEAKDHLGCSDTLPAGKLPTASCTIYFTDDGYPLTASAPAVASSPVSSPNIVQNDPIVTQPVQNTPIVDASPVSTPAPQATVTPTKRFPSVMIIASTTDISASTTQIIASQARLIAILQKLIALFQALLSLK